ncbi:MAG: helix-turn-helix transcriptional regulator [Nitrospirota bacterium]|jgi:transcriptional regulator with XRE-family HTH domain
MKAAKDTKYIGSLIRDMRKASGMSQMKLAEKIGVSYQQIQKYEKGASQLNISRLLQISEAFGVPVGTFLGDGEAEVSQIKPPYSSLSEDEAKLVMLFRRLKRKKLRDGFVEMLQDIVRLSETSS